MHVRDEIERAIAAWDEHETARGALPIIDFDFRPDIPKAQPAPDRLTVHTQLQKLRDQVLTGTDAQPSLLARLDSDLAYLRALMGERSDLESYVKATQGCRAAGWPPEYVDSVARTLQDSLIDIGVSWDSEAQRSLESTEDPISADEAPDAIRHWASILEPSVRDAVGSKSPFKLSIETTSIDAYWAYWLDGAGSNVRMRLNMRRAKFTTVQARQFALHEILGHGLQCASLADRCRQEDVRWVRIASVHGPHQVLSEGMAQALPLFVTPDDKALRIRVHLAHYLNLVRAELHVAINSGASLENCAKHARRRVPFWTDGDIADTLSDRGTNPLLRSYLWAYPAGLDWFVALAGADAKVIGEVLHAAYRDPLTPSQLRELWPEGPAIGGPGCSIRLWEPDVP